MKEYNFLCKMIDKKFLADPPATMTEAKGDILKPQTVYINSKGCNGVSFSLYRFDRDKVELLPFFDCTHDAPEGLKGFCDYILLTERKGTTNIILVEMKRGSGLHKAQRQLNATKTFMDYVVASAERLRDDFHSDDNGDFDKRNIEWRKVILKSCKSNKEATKVRNDIDPNQEFILYKSPGSFRLALLT